MKWKTGPFYHHYKSIGLMEKEENRCQDFSDKYYFKRSTKPIEPIHMDEMNFVEWSTKTTRHLTVNIGAIGAGEYRRLRHDIEIDIEGCFCVSSRWNHGIEMVRISNSIF